EDGMISPMRARTFSMPGAYTWTTSGSRMSGISEAFGPMPLPALFSRRPLVSEASHAHWRRLGRLAARADPVGQQSSSDRRLKNARLVVPRRQPGIRKARHAVDDRQSIRVPGSEAAPLVRDAHLSRGREPGLQFGNHARDDLRPHVWRDVARVNRAAHQPAAVL